MSAPLGVLLDAAGADDAQLGACLARLSDGVMTGLVRRLVLVGADGRLDEIAEAIGAERHFGPMAAAAETLETPWALEWTARAAPPPGWAEAAAAHIAGGCGDRAAFGLTGGVWPALRAELAFLGALPPLPEQGLLRPSAGGRGRLRRLSGAAAVKG